MTDDEIEALAKKHIAPHADRLDAIMANPVPYQQTEQFRRVKSLIGDVLSKLRAPVADEDDQPTAPDDDAIAECWVSVSDIDGIAYDGPSFERGYRAALASAPVAGEAVAHAVISYGRIQRLVVNEESAHEYAEQQRLNAEAAGWDAKAHVRPLVYGDAAPQASEAAPFAPDWANYRQGWADGLAEGNEAIDIARTALMEIADLADVEADQRGVIVNAALTRINEITSRPALSAQPGAQKGGSDA